MRLISNAVGGLASIALALLVAAASSSAVADNFIVDGPGYSLDINPGNGTCADSNGKCLAVALESGSRD